MALRIRAVYAAAGMACDCGYSVLAVNRQYCSLCLLHGCNLPHAVDSHRSPRRITPRLSIWKGNPMTCIRGISRNSKQPSFTHTHTHISSSHCLKVQSTVVCDARVYSTRANCGPFLFLAFLFYINFLFFFSFLHCATGQGLRPPHFRFFRHTHTQMQRRVQDSGAESVTHTTKVKDSWM